MGQWFRVITFHHENRIPGMTFLSYFHRMNTVLITSDLIASKIYLLRGERVLLDVDLALLYGVKAKRLKEAVRRNLGRFPEDFMFQLSVEEWQNLRSQIASSSWGGQRYPPYAFSEQGVAMLSSVLRSTTAINLNNAIMRTFVGLRKWMQSNKELATKIPQLENKYDSQFKVVFDAIRQLIQQDKEIRPIGFKVQAK
jgi:hypothetical protein